MFFHHSGKESPTMNHQQNQFIIVLWRKSGRSDLISTLIFNRYY